MKKHVKSGRKFVSVHTKTDPKNDLDITTREIRYKDVVVEKDYSSDGMTQGINKHRPSEKRAAIVHDKVCTGAISTVTGKRISRKTGDKYFKEILILDGVSSWRAHCKYLAVRGFAIVTFKK